MEFFPCFSVRAVHTHTHTRTKLHARIFGSTEYALKPIFYNLAFIEHLFHVRHCSGHQGIDDDYDVYWKR